MFRKIFLEKFRCNMDNDGDDSDSPYFLVFAGMPSLEFRSLVEPIYLENLDDTVAPTGAWTLVHERVPGFNVDDTMFVLVALLERDDDLDLTGAEFDALAKQMAERYLHFAGKEHLQGEALIRRMRREFRRAINGHTNNDDLIGIKHLPIPRFGEPDQLLFKNDPDDGSYTVAFRLEAA
jgi:hypothetical protein